MLAANSFYKAPGALIIASATQSKVWSSTAYLRELSQVWSRMLLRSPLRLQRCGGELLRPKVGNLYSLRIPIPAKAQDRGPEEVLRAEQNQGGSALPIRVRLLPVGLFRASLSGTALSLRVRESSTNRSQFTALCPRLPHSLLPMLLTVSQRTSLLCIAIEL